MFISLLTLFGLFCAFAPSPPHPHRPLEDTAPRKNNASTGCTRDPCSPRRTRKRRPTSIWWERRWNKKKNTVTNCWRRRTQISPARVRANTLLTSSLACLASLYAMHAPRLSLLSCLPSSEGLSGRSMSKAPPFFSFFFSFYKTRFADWWPQWCGWVLEWRPLSFFPFMIQGYMVQGNVV